MHAPENTLVGFERAAALGAASIEFDVRPTRDGVFVVHHDPATSDGAVICDTDRAELDPAIPTLADVARTCPDMGLDIELKTDAAGLDAQHYADRAMTDIEACCGDRVDDVLITSFDTTVLAAIAGQQFATGLLFWNALRPQQAIERALLDGHVAIVPWIPFVTADLVADAREADLAILTWTVNSVEQVRQAIDADVDVIIGDDPALIARTLGGQSL